MALSRESTRYANTTGFVKTALDMVEKEPEVLDMIGQPYSLGKAKVLDLWFGFDTNNVKVRVPVKGANDTAFIYAFARKKDSKDKLKLFKLEMTFNKIQGKKMILFDVSDKGTEHDIISADPEENKRKIQQKRSAVPDGMIPERNSNEPRRIPKAILRHRKLTESTDDAKSTQQTSSTTKTTDDAKATDDDKSSDQPKQPR